jgi:hypothetical protein
VSQSNPKVVQTIRHDINVISNCGNIHKDHRYRNPYKLFAYHKVLVKKRSPEVLANCKLLINNRDTKYYKEQKVRNQKCPSAIFKYQIREPPQAPETNCTASGHEPEVCI